MRYDDAEPVTRFVYETIRSASGWYGLLKDRSTGTKYKLGPCPTEEAADKVVLDRCHQMEAT